MNQSINSSQMRPTLFKQDHSQIGTAGTHDWQHPDHHDECAGTDDWRADHQQLLDVGQ